jgi:hypothetical protein
VSFTLASLPALVALLCKFVLLGYAVRRPSRNLTTRLFFALLVVLSVQNLVEVVGYSQLARGNYAHADTIGRLYFAMVIPFVALMLHLSLRLSYDPPLLGRLDRYAWLLYLPAVGLEALLPGEQLIAGFKPFQNSLLREPGPWYFLFETYATAYMLAALSGMFYGARGARRNALARTRNRLWLFALSPIALLVVYLIVANHFGWTRLTSTFYLPLAVTFFLFVTTYATYEYRLFDVEFFLPWSKVRRRKTAFYQRIQATIAEIAELRSVRQVLDLMAHTLRCQVALIGGPRPLVALAPGQESGTGDRLVLPQFPREALAEVDQIVIANEIADLRPDLHRLMRRHKVGAIVPFGSHGATAGHWMLLGEHFSDSVYTPLDFKRVEALFNRIAERFLDDLLLLRTQLTDAKEEIRDYQRRLAIAWEELTTLRRKLTGAESENRRLRDDNARLRRAQMRLVGSALPAPVLKGDKTLEQYLTEYEAALVTAALLEAGGDRKQAARLLRLSPRTLQYLIERHHLERERPRD